MSDSSGRNRPGLTPGRADEDWSAPGARGNDSAARGELVPYSSGGAIQPYDDSLVSPHFLGMAVGDQLDAFRELRTRLLAMAATGGLHRFTVLVSPVSRSSGAAFVSRNLAVAFTLQERQRAILIDCNLRNPAQHIAFDLMDNSDGLFDYLESPTPQPDRLLYRTEIEGLYLIPAGRPSSSAREYFSSQAMCALLAWLRKSPCFLVLDGPTAHGSPDARILSELVDLVVLVAGYGRDTAQSIARAAALFPPAKFAGVVFNNQS